MLVVAVLVRFFSFSFTPLFLLFFNDVVFLLSASRSINCAVSSERTIATIVCMFCGPIVLAHGCYMTREFRRELAFFILIKSGYHHIVIFPPHHEFLGFSWFKDGFTVLPFGLSTGPYIFTKVMRSLVHYCRLQAFRIAVYLDDGLGVCPSFADCCSQSLGVKSDLFLCWVCGKTTRKAAGLQCSLFGVGPYQTLGLRLS